MSSKFKEKLNTWTANIGGVPGLAGRLKIQRQAIYQWRKIPTTRLLEVEKITGVSRAILRPDLFAGYDAKSPAKVDVPAATAGVAR